jgi:hypothetical protein
MAELPGTPPVRVAPSIWAEPAIPTAALFATPLNLGEALSDGSTRHKLSDDRVQGTGA